MRCEFMVCAVTRQEGDRNVVVLEDVDGRGGVAPGRERIDGRNGDVAGEGLQAGTADYSYVDGF